jgi:hypothetical protein
MKNLMDMDPKLADTTVEDFLTQTGDINELRPLLTEKQLKGKIGDLRPDLFAGAAPGEPSVAIFDPTRGGPAGPAIGETQTAKAMAPIPPDIQVVLAHHTAKNLLYAQVVAFLRSNTLIQMGETYWGWIRSAAKATTR